ncbi:FMN-linked oxidoreductase [Rickenella mellea]|uniref:FMN-linked oxidoreductase n=1 Tax=Rickenella mellea TaxID=50990 RepID=A0A4Y7QCI3_9AGAM|nr:FMN-linked oxidoreductase [Rickenella mellea]
MSVLRSPETVQAANTSSYTPAQNPPSGTALDPQPDGRPIPKLFQPIKIRGVKFQNRIFLSPMCQYSADNGSLTPWHMAHLGSILTRGPGLTFVEATAVVPQGRITPHDSGIWSDEQIPALRQIVTFAHSQNQKIAIQIAHAGRKASAVAPWLSASATATEDIGGWPNDVWAPSAIPFRETSPQPKALTCDGIRAIVQAFAEAAKRAVKAGFDVIEIHNGHRYLLHQFISPVSNKRTDEYGGSFENRTRLTLEVVDAVRAVIPSDMPLFLRIPASDWLEESTPNEPSWRVEDTVKLAGNLADHGVDLLDVASGVNHPKQDVAAGPIAAEQAYQAHVSQAVKRAHGDRIVVGVVGGIKSGIVAQDVLDRGMADVVFIGRQFQRDPGTVWTFAEQLGVHIKVAHQIEWGFKGHGPSVVKTKSVGKL